MDLDHREDSNDKIHPSHYILKDGTTCFGIMREIFGDTVVYDHCILTAFEYLFRSPNKNGHEDILKANEFLNEAIEIYNNL